MTAEIKLDFLLKRIDTLETTLSDLLADTVHDCNEEVCPVTIAKRVLGDKNYRPRRRREEALRKILKEEEIYAVKLERKLRQISEALESLTVIGWNKEDEGETFQDGVLFAADRVVENIRHLRQEASLPGAADNDE